MGKNKREGFLSLEFNFLLLVVMIAFVALSITFKSEIASVFNQAGSEIISKEEVSGKQVINNPTGVGGVDSGNGTVTFPPEFNDQTVIMNRLFFENTESCTISKNNAYRCTVDVGQTIFIYPKWMPKNVTKTSIAWKQLNGKDYATMVQSFDTHTMEIFGKKAGSTSVQAKSIDGSSLAVTAFIDVIQRATQVVLNKTSGTLSLSKPSETITVVASVLPEDTTNKQITWGFLKGDTGPQECVSLSSEGQQLTISLRPSCKLATTGVVKITATSENGVTPLQPFSLTINK